MSDYACSVCKNRLQLVDNYYYCSNCGVPRDPMTDKDWDDRVQWLIDRGIFDAKWKGLVIETLAPTASPDTRLREAVNTLLEEISDHECGGGVKEFAEDVRAALNLKCEGR